MSDTLDASRGPVDETVRIEFLLEAERYTDAMRLIAPVLASSPENPVLWSCAAQAQLGNEQWTAALHSASQLVALDPEDGLGHYFASFALTQLYRFNDGLDAALAAMRLNPDRPHFHLRVAECAAVLSQTQLAWSAANRAVGLAPHDDEVHTAFGGVACELGKPDVGEQAFRHALQLNPANRLAQHNLGIVQARRGMIGGATRTLRSAAAADPRSDEAGQALFNLVRHSVQRAQWWLWATLVACQLLGHLSSRPGLRIELLACVAVSLMFLVGWLCWSLRGMDAQSWRLVGRCFRRSITTTLWLACIIVGAGFLMLAVLIPDESLRTAVIVMSGLSLVGGVMMCVLGMLIHD